MYAGRVACCPLVSYGEYADGTDRQTDGRTPDRYITRSGLYNKFLGSCAHVFILIFSLFFVSGPCARLSWPSRQLLSAR